MLLVVTEFEMEMKKTSTNTQLQLYPRIQDEDDFFNGYLDDDKLEVHKTSISEEELEQLILDAIDKANEKSAREMILIGSTTTDEDKEKIYKERAWELFKYFQTYPGDPASTAHQLEGKNTKEVAEDLFRLKTLQMERMNSGWRYQYLVVDCASRTGRFAQISDRGAKEADFVAVIRYRNALQANDQVNLYVSVKNRINTIGGPDWPKSIADLENYASSDKNRVGPYCCVFGIAMSAGKRQIKRRGKTKEVYSWNTEVWLSDYFWPFFTNKSYTEIMLHVLDVLKSAGYQADKLPNQIQLPPQFITAFDEYCFSAGLTQNSIFHDPYKLVEFFCGGTVKKPTIRKSKR